MVTNPHILEAFERDLQRTQNLTLEEKYALLDGMYELAVRLGHFTSDRALEGIENTIQLAKALNLNGVDVTFASLEDIVIHKLVAGRPRDIDDAQSILLRQQGLDAAYVEKWLKEFEPVVGRELVNVFRSHGER